MNVIDRMNKAMNSLKMAKEKYEKGEKRLSLGDIDYAYDYLISVKYLMLAEIEEEAVKEHHKQKVKESYNKAIELNGEALKRLKDN